MRFLVKIVKNRQNSNVAITILNIRISQGFLLIQKENDNSKIQLHSMQIFLKMATSNFEKLKKVASPSDFDSLPYPRVRWYPKFYFIKMTGKDLKEITCTPQVTFFSVLKGPRKTLDEG